MVRAALFASRYGQVAKDDVLEAMVAPVSASVGPDGLTAIPTVAVYDSQGFPTQIVYPALGALARAASGPPF